MLSVLTHFTFVPALGVALLLLGVVFFFVVRSSRAKQQTDSGSQAERQASGQSEQPQRQAKAQSKHQRQKQRQQMQTKAGKDQQQQQAEMWPSTQEQARPDAQAQQHSEPPLQPRIDPKDDGSRGSARCGTPEAAETELEPVALGEPVPESLRPGVAELEPSSINLLGKASGEDAEALERAQSTSTAPEDSKTDVGDDCNGLSGDSSSEADVASQPPWLAWEDLYEILGAEKPQVPPVGPEQDPSKVCCRYIPVLVRMDPSAEDLDPACYVKVHPTLDVFAAKHHLQSDTEVHTGSPRAPSP